MSTLFKFNQLPRLYWLLLDVGIQFCNLILKLSQGFSLELSFGKTGLRERIIVVALLLGLLWPSVLHAFDQRKERAFFIDELLDFSLVKVFKLDAFNLSFLNWYQVKGQSGSHHHI